MANEKIRQWQKDNAAREKQMKAEYYQKNREKLLKKAAEYRRKNRAKINAAKKKLRLVKKQENDL